MTSLTLQLPPGGWKLLNAVHDSHGSARRPRAATLLQRCGMTVEDLLDLSSQNRGFICAVTATGDDAPMAANEQLAADLRRVLLRLTPLGLTWVTTTPANVVLRTIAGTPQMWSMCLDDLLKVDHVDPDVVRSVHEAGLAWVCYAGTRDPLPAVTPLVFRFARDFEVRPSPRGRDLVNL